MYMYIYMHIYMIVCGTYVHVHVYALCSSLKGVVIKYSEPPEARQPSTRWRLYQFKGEEVLRELFSIVHVQFNMLLVLH